MADAYSDFAYVYDQLMDNIPYEDWTNYIISLLKDHHIDNGLVAELGCGTGTITELLSQAGYDMIGIDNAPAMLDIARTKSEENGSSALYLCQDMREFELYGTVAAVISVCDSINYITEPSELITVFKLVNNYLDSKGLFIFDFNTKHYYQDIVADSTIAEARDDISFIWDNYFDEEASINELALTLFIQEESSELFRKYEELHLQRGYEVDEMIKLVNDSGLELVACYDAFTKNKATSDSQRVYIIARESNQENKYYNN